MFESIDVKIVGEDQLPIIFLEKWKYNKVIHIKGIGHEIYNNSKLLRNFYDRFTQKVGKPLNLAEDATINDTSLQRTGEVWSEIRYDPKIKDAYRHSCNPQPLHTDGSYIPSFPDASLMYCFQSSNTGGETIFIDSEDLLKILENEDTELKTDLISTTVVHERSGDKRISKIINISDDYKKLHWNYYCVNKDNKKIKNICERFFSFLNDNLTIKKYIKPVHLMPGECVIWKDHETLHGRNGFNPKTTSERFLYKSSVQVNVG